MIHVILLCFAMLADGGKPAQATTADRAAYEAAAAKAGKNAAAHVKLALWCETHGLSSERIKHLSIATKLDPSNVLARGLLGLLAFQGKWSKPDQVEKEVRDDPKWDAIFREYLDRRLHTHPKNVDAQMRLAAWCLDKGLKDEAMAHYHVVTRLDPSRAIAWVRLGYKKHHDRWSRPEVLAEQKLEAERQKHADKEWKARLEKLREAMESSVEARRLTAERELYQVTDPRAVPMIFKIFGNGSEKMQIVAVELLSQIEGPSSSLCILALAIEKQSSDVRERAARALARRDPRDSIGWLVHLVRKPFKYEIRPANGQTSTGVLMVEGERFNIRRLYRPPEIELTLIPPWDILLATGVDQATTGVFLSAGNSPAQQKAAAIASGIAQQLFANAIMNEEMRRVYAVNQSFENDVRMLQAMNDQIDRSNGRVLPLLETLTGQNFGTEPTQWRTWWADQLGLVSEERYADANKPTFSEFVTLPDVSPPHHACFAAGTLVQTFRGPTKIESISLGDRVLAQNTTTGALDFRPVLSTHVNGPAETLRIAIGGEVIVATGIHRFWKAGKGWTMARDLKTGDRLRTLGGIATIDSIEPGATQMVYNLNVAENRDFLVGSAGLLVHDYSFVLPVSDPFDRVTSAAPIASR